jgi:hypothetical protein
MNMTASLTFGGHQTFLQARLIDTLLVIDRYTESFTGYGKLHVKIKGSSFFGCKNMALEDYSCVIYTY